MLPCDSRCGSVPAFEIVPDVFDLLRENCARNGVLDRVILHQAGLGDPARTFRVPAHSGGSALPDFYSSRLHFDEGVVVPFESLDSLISQVQENGQAESRPVLMKVDVEGTEDEVFRFGKRFLSAWRPTIMCEVLQGSETGAFLQVILEPLGYRFFVVGAGDLLPRKAIEPDEHFRDWLFALEDVRLPPTE